MSLTKSTGGPCGPNSPNFIRAELLPSGYLIRPCEGGGSMIYIVDHVDLDVSSNSTSILLTVQLSSFAKCAPCLYEEIFNLLVSTFYHRLGVFLRSLDHSMNLQRSWHRR
jgi:hypothetical protein